jgi:hypothetical protein
LRRRPRPLRRMLPRMMRSEEQTTSKWNEKRIMRNKLLFGMSGGRRLRMLILLVWAVMVGIVKVRTQGAINRES